MKDKVYYREFLSARFARTTHIQFTGGLMSDKDYPYETNNNGTCRYDPEKKVASISGYKDVQGNFFGHIDPEDLALSVLENGPHSIYLYASENMHMYESGIFSSDGCSTIESLLFNHAVNIVKMGLAMIHSIK